jgi:hypothetical protein
VDRDDEPAPEVLFAGIAVADFDGALSWYGKLFGRPADVVAHDKEVMWRATPGGWIYVVGDPSRAGHSLVALAVEDLATSLAAIEDPGDRSRPDREACLGDEGVGP